MKPLIHVTEIEGEYKTDLDGDCWLGDGDFLHEGRNKNLFSLLPEEARAGRWKFRITVEATPLALKGRRRS